MFFEINSVIHQSYRINNWLSDTVCIRNEMSSPGYLPSNCFFVLDATVICTIEMHISIHIYIYMEKERNLSINNKYREINILHIHAQDLVIIYYFTLAKTKQIKVFSDNIRIAVLMVSS